MHRFMNRAQIGRLYDIQGFSVHDGPGIRTTVFLKGCPLHCLWCHSPESISCQYELSRMEMRCVGIDACGLCVDACPSKAISPGEAVMGGEGALIRTAEVDRTRCTACLTCTQVCPSKALAPSGYEMTVDQVAQRVLRDAPFFGTDGGVTISGGEPMLQFSFTLELARRLKEAGISVCLDTTGYAPAEHYAQLLPYIDFFLYDLKHMSSEQHQKLTGVPNERILDNARSIAAQGGKLQIRIPAIPTLNATLENMEAAAKFCAQLGDAVRVVQLLPYHSFGKAKYDRLGIPYPLAALLPPTEEEMGVFLKLMQSYGLHAQIH